MRPRIVLVEPSHPGNIGAAARAMKTMGLSELCLVKPKKFPHSDAYAMASNATDVLDNADIATSLAEAIADCVQVFGSSARLRTADFITQTPRAAFAVLQKKFRSQATAIVFGRERTGLTNAELNLCNEQIHIPANAEYSSLNLAQAVQIVCYEYLLSTQEHNEQPYSKARDTASSAEVQGMLEHIKSVALKTDFLDRSQPKYLMIHLARLFSRCQLNLKEVNIIRGICTAVDKQLRRIK